MIQIANVVVADPISPWHGKRVNLTIEGERIIEVLNAETILASDVTLDGQGTIWVFPGLVDTMARWGHPFTDSAETLASGAQSAASGGFVRVLLSPHSYPFIRNAATVEATLQSATGLPIMVDVAASASMDPDNWRMAPVGEMLRAGALGVAIGKQYISAHHLQSLVEYIRDWDVPLWVFAGAWSQDLPLIWEGPTSAKSGLTGALPDAEYHWAMQVRTLAHRTGVRIIFYNASDPAILDLQSDLFTVAISPFHLRWDDEQLLKWDSRFKFTPPLRPPDTVRTLHHRIAQIGMLFSDHQPCLFHQKVNDFVAADPGGIAHATALPLLQQVIGSESMMEIVPMLFSHHPRQWVGWPTVTIQPGAPAELTFYDPTYEWLLTDATNYSRSSNSPVWGSLLMGKTTHILTPKKLLAC